MIYLKPLSISDRMDVFIMLKDIRSIENSFTNPVRDMNYTDYKAWLLQQDKWSRGVDLPKGFVPQTIYWLFDNTTPIGIGKIRHGLNQQSRKAGGNIGYAIRTSKRGQGYGVILLKYLLKEARLMGIDEILLTVDKGNFASKRICEKNNGVLVGENCERWYFRF